MLPGILTATFLGTGLLGVGWYSLQAKRHDASSDQEHACQSTPKTPRRFTPFSSKSVDAYHCDAIAEAPSRVTVISKRDVGRDASEVLELARVMAGQVRNLRARLEIRNIRSADQRLLAWLRLKARGNPPRVELDRTWTPDSEEIGLTREATCRALSGMRRTGRIRMERRILRLAEPAAEIVTRLV